MAEWRRTRRRAAAPGASAARAARPEQVVRPSGHDSAGPELQQRAPRGVTTGRRSEEACDRTSAEGAIARSAGGRASARTSAGGATARSAGGRASARTSARGAPARSAGGRASARTSAGGAAARSAGGQASASTSTSGAAARSAARRQMSQCRTGWRSLEKARIAPQLVTGISTCLADGTKCLAHARGGRCEWSERGHCVP